MSDDDRPEGLDPSTARGDAHERGRDAESPAEIPRRGWRDIALRTKEQLDADNIGIVAAGVAFYAFLSIFPALTALVSIYGLVADPADVERNVAGLAGVLPKEALSILGDQLHGLASTQTGALGVGAIAGILLAIWSASKGVKALMTALNIAYGERERRGFLRVNATALGLVVAGLVAALLSLGAIVAIPIVLDLSSAPGWLEDLVHVVRWPILAAAIVAVLTVVYRYGPSRDRPRWTWVSWGSGLSTISWLVASIAFSIYVANFGDYNESYGTFGAIVVLLMWLFISAYVVLLGAELNAELEHQTERDTTVGARRPLGRRGASMADTIGDPR
ncbi:YihY/virulence factor BrkB family protein [Myxococcota bacterium]|nr:YihY/virulence factor BrkB family protein [Myxococcota bacterium]